jgi:hypothetical protein
MNNQSLKMYCNKENNHKYELYIFYPSFDWLYKFIVFDNKKKESKIQNKTKTKTKQNKKKKTKTKAMN